MIFDILDGKVDMKTLLALFCILVFGILFIYLKQDNYQLNVKGYNIEHFPSTLRYTDNIRQTPKNVITKLTDEMKYNSKNFSTLPDDYDYLYNYEKNFDLNKVYGDYNSKLDAYQDFLYKHKNSFHNLDDKDVDNLIKLLNGINLSNSDIPDNFEYKKDFRASNNN